MAEAKKEERKTLREWREEFGLLQKELADLVGCNASTIGYLERKEAEATTTTLEKIARALGLHVNQIDTSKQPLEARIDTSGWSDGFSLSAPRAGLKWWRMHRGLSIRELSRISGCSMRSITNLEGGCQKGYRPPTKRKLADALRVSLENLIIDGDDLPPREKQATEFALRSDVREKARVIKRMHDFLIDDARITFRYQDDRDALLRDIGPELKGL